ncbi:MAG: hypothetical protein HC921_06105 [Synechococcaceae cyanobacterium SM2_3_1]|nr:hypothetical protein [Synechococcaceae cyanobacterium SM2_3_1]
MINTRHVPMLLSALLLLGMTAPMAQARPSALQEEIYQARIQQGKDVDVVRLRGFSEDNAVENLAAYSDIDQVNSEVDENLVASPVSDSPASPMTEAPLLEIRADSEPNSRR